MIPIVQVEAADWNTEIQFWFCSMLVDPTLAFSKILRRDTSLFLCELWIYFSNVTLVFITTYVFCWRHACYPAIKQQNSLISYIRTHKRTGDKKTVISITYTYPHAIILKSFLSNNKNTNSLTTKTNNEFQARSSLYLWFWQTRHHCGNFSLMNSPDQQSNKQGTRWMFVPQTYHSYMSTFAHFSSVNGFRNWRRRY
jgi:hypothetical protein